MQREIDERKGLHKARNSNGTIIKAGPNTVGRFKCIFCGCELYVTHRDSNYYFACMPGGQHDKNKPCYAMVEHGRDYSDPDKSPAELIKTLLLPAAPPRGGGGTPGGGGKGRDTGGTIPPNEDGPNNSPIKTLKDIVKNGTQYYNPDDSFGEDYKVSDFLLTHKWGDSVLINKRHPLNYRIILARFEFYNDVSKELTFIVFKLNIYSCRFILKFSDITDYIYYRDKFTEFRKFENGTTKRCRKNNCKDALLAGLWHQGNHSPAKCSCTSKRITEKSCKNCLGFYYTDFTSSKQIELITPDND